MDGFKPDPIKRLELEANFTAKALQASQQLIQDLTQIKMITPELARLCQGYLDVAMDEMSAPRFSRSVVIKMFRDAFDNALADYDAPEAEKKQFLVDFEPAFQRRMKEI